jgi:hypothetical protein
VLTQTTRYLVAYKSGTINVSHETGEPVPCPPFKPANFIATTKQSWQIGNSK